MNILFLLLPISLVFTGVFVLGFILAVRNGQYEDLESPAYRALIDDGLKNKE